MSSSAPNPNNQLCDDQSSAHSSPFALARSGANQQPHRIRRPTPAVDAAAALGSSSATATSRRSTRSSCRSDASSKLASPLTLSKPSTSQLEISLSEQRATELETVLASAALTTPISRLTKTRNSSIYFSDSDDVDAGPQHVGRSSAVVGQSAPGGHTAPLPPPRQRFTTVSRSQQQHHRRHRQLYRTFTPFDLRTLDQQINEPQSLATEPPGGHHTIREESTDDDDDNEHADTGPTGANHNVHRGASAAAAPRLRESPAHQRHNTSSNKHYQPASGASRRSVSRSPVKRTTTVRTATPVLADSPSPRRSLADKRSMLLSYGPETICVLALVLTTFATFQNNSPKLARLAAAPAFFPSDSLVHDFPAGNLDAVQNRVKASDISLVFFYAPWSADCQHARTSYAQTARLYDSHIYFAAVNCWQPGGECRAQYAKIHEWPVAMAYYQTGLAVPYTGRWSTASVLRFVRALQRPLQRVHDNDGMLRLMMSHDAVVVAFLADIEAPGAAYDTFYTAAVKWLERDPFQSVAFAVVTGAPTVRSFGVQRPLVRVYQWNGTVEHEFDDASWTQVRMHSWLLAQMIRVSAWLQPPGTKASTLAPHLQRGPVLMLFTPRNAVSVMPAANDAYDMMRQIGLDYSNCASVNQPWIAEMSRTYITHVRTENRRAHEQFVAECGRLRAEEARAEAQCLSDVMHRESNADGIGRSTAGQHQHQQQHQHVASIVFGNVVNSSSKMPSGAAALLKHCGTIGPRQANEMCDGAGQQTCAKRSPSPVGSCSSAHTGSMSPDDAAAYHTSMLDVVNDDRAPVNLLRQSTRKLCDLHTAGEQLTDFPRAQFFEVTDEWANFQRVSELGCVRNRTLSFVAVDSALYHVYAERLGVDVLRSADQTSAVIVDHEFESSFVHDGPITTNSLIDFVHNYTAYKLERHLKVGTETLRDKNVRHRRVELPPLTASTETLPNRVHSNVELRNIDSQTFEASVLQSNKTVFVLFHSLQCALCAPMSHSLLLASHLLAELQTHIDIVRIDGDQNDLPWHYTVDRLPALIAFPAGVRSVESRIYPSGLAATVPNVLSFVLANVERPVRLHGMVLVCNGVRPKFGLSADCARTIRTEIHDDIAFSLRQWRSRTHLRGGIVRRLQALQRLLLQLYRADESDDGGALLRLAHAVRKVWPTAQST